MSQCKKRCSTRRSLTKRSPKDSTRCTDIKANGRLSSESWSSAYSSDECSYLTSEEEQRLNRDLNADGRPSSESSSSAYSSDDYSYLTSEEEQRLNRDLNDSYNVSSIEELLDVSFNKKFHINLNIIWTKGNCIPLPWYSSEMWIDEKLLALKEKLNTVNKKLNNYDLNEWNQFTRNSNPADLVLRNLMKMDCSTQTWCKFYEIVETFDLIPRNAKKSKKLYSFHMCETSGAVAALNHYLKLNHSDIEWDWKANSLNPFHEGNPPNDQFMIGRRDNWDFGPDNTGDILHNGYPEHLVPIYDNDKAHLVTADGSFDCQDNPDGDSWLYLKETLVALKILRTGGHFVIKISTLFECNTICLLYCLFTLFESLHVIKPVTSEEGSSEVYVICKVFKGLLNEREHYVKELYSITEEQHKQFAMFPINVMKRQFVSLIRECANGFIDNQLSVINRNIQLYPYREDEELKQHFKLVKRKMWERFVSYYKIKPISDSQKIAPMDKIQRLTNVTEKREWRRDSRIDQRNEIIKKTIQELNEFEYKSSTSISQKSMPFIEIVDPNLIPMYGKPIKHVKSSQFCDSTLIRIRNQMIDAFTITNYNSLSTPVGNGIVETDNCKVCDFREMFSTSDYNAYAQLQALRTINNKLRIMKDRDDLVLIGFPSLTRFNVSVLCCLGQCFNEVVSKDPFTLILRGLNNYLLDAGWRLNIDQTLHLYYASISNENILLRLFPKFPPTWDYCLPVELDKQLSLVLSSFLSLDYLLTEPLYSWFVELNNARVCAEIRQVISAWDAIEWLSNLKQM